MTTDLTVYHRKPADIQGTALLPLNRLRKTHPDLHAGYMAKYRGREAIPSRSLPELECTWGDCVMFSTVHPAAIRDAMRQSGHCWPENGHRFMAFRLQDVAFSDADTAIWPYEDTRPTEDFSAPKSGVLRFIRATG